ncbi:MAG: winged helix-turn-helix domain-containing protein [Candidatus Sericytochromatia bacterium]|nr:winged helix-turn-helix domain-containing protein [Candidatus Sericytochromatia bacterium]
MTRQDFANIAGTSRETMTRVLIDLEEEGIIFSNKNQIIINNVLDLKNKIL